MTFWNRLLPLYFCLLLSFSGFAAIAQDTKETPAVSLLAAIHGKEVKLVKALLENGTSPDSKSEGFTALTAAADEGSLEICRLLIEKGANLATPSDDGFTPFEYACCSGSMPLVRYLMEKGAKFDKKLSPLGYVVEAGHLDIARLLLDLGADPNELNRWDEPILTNAARHKSFPIFQLLIDRKANPSVQDKDGMTATMQAAKASSVEMIRALIDLKVDLNLQDKTYKTALQYAAGPDKAMIISLLRGAGAKEIPLNLFSAVLQEDYKSLQTLLDNGADPNVVDAEGRTPLHLAAQDKRLPALKLLLSKGANPNIADKQGKRPIEIAATLKSFDGSEAIKALRNAGADALEFDLFDAIDKGRFGMVKALFDRGVSIEAKDDQGRTPLRRALVTKAGNVELTKYLLDRGTNVNAMGDDDISPFHEVVSQGNLELVKQFLAKGADVNAGKPDHMTALMFATREDHREIFRLLDDKGADVRAKSSFGRTVLYQVAEEGTLEMMRLVLDKGATPDINVPSEEGITPLWVAVGTSDLDKVQLLLDKGANPNLNEKETNVSPLMKAVQAHAGNDEETCEKLIRMLLSKGAKADVVDNQGRTAATIAEEKDNPDLVKLLKTAGATSPRPSADQRMERALSKHSLPDVKKALADGADLRVNIFDIHTPLAEAIGNGDLEIVRFLLSKGADPNDSGKKKAFTPLGVAAERRDATILRLLLKSGAKPNVKSIGTTPLDTALLNGNVEAVKAPLEAGADARLWEPGQLDSLMCAVRSGNPELVGLMLAKGSPVNPSPEIGSTALHEAMLWGKSTSIAQILIDKGAKIDARDSEGGTPLHAAVKFGNILGLKLLLAHGANPNAENNSNKTPLDLLATSFVDEGDKRQLRLLLQQSGGK